MKIQQVLLVCLFPLLVKSQDELEQCRASCYEKHTQATQVTRGKMGPRGLAGPAGPKGSTGLPGERGPVGPPGKDCGASNFGVRVDDVERQLVGMENKIKERDSKIEDQENEIKKLKSLQELYNRPGKLYFVIFFSFKTNCFYCLYKNKKALKINASKAWFTTKTFGYRDVLYLDTV